MKEQNCPSYSQTACSMPIFSFPYVNHLPNKQQILFYLLLQLLSSCERVNIILSKSCKQKILYSAYHACSYELLYIVCEENKRFIYLLFYLESRIRWEFSCSNNNSDGIGVNYCTNLSFIRAAGAVATTVRRCSRCATVQRSSCTATCSRSLGTSDGQYIGSTVGRCSSHWYRIRSSVARFLSAPHW